MTQKPCKRGNIAPRSASGHCQCGDCKLFRSRNNWTPKRAKYQREWQRKNSDKTKDYQRRWNETHKDQRRLIEKAWKDANPEKVKLHYKRAGAKWTKANPGLVMARVRRRQAAKLQRTPSWANHEKIKSIYVEAAKLTAETGIPHEVDHFYPLQGDLVSGLHVENNLQILTRFANRSKGNKYG